jgi:hypothetical protein
MQQPSPSAGSASMLGNSASDSHSRLATGCNESFRQALQNPYFVSTTTATNPDNSINNSHKKSKLGRSVRFSDALGGIDANMSDDVLARIERPVYCDTIGNDDSILDITFALNDLNTSLANYKDDFQGGRSGVYRANDIEKVPNQTTLRHQRQVMDSALAASPVIPVALLPTSNHDFEEVVVVPEDLLIRIELARREYEAELANKRKQALASLKAALQEGAQSYLDDLKAKLATMKFNEKYNLPISKEHEQRRSTLMDSICRAVVEEAKDAFHCPSYTYWVDADFGFQDPDYRASLADKRTSVNCTAMPIPEECRARILCTVEAVKDSKLQQLEADMQAESGSQVAEIEGHIRSREKYWANRIETEVVTVYNNRLAAYVQTRKQEVKTNVEHLRRQLEERSFMDLARTKAAEIMVIFNESVGLIKSASVDTLVEAVAFCGEVGKDIDTADFTTHGTPVRTARAPAASKASDAIYLQIQQLQKLLITSDLAKRRLMCSMDR